MTCPVAEFQAQLTGKFEEFLVWVRDYMEVPEPIIREALENISKQPDPRATKPSKAKSKKAEQDDEREICIAMLKSKEGQQCTKRVSDKSETGNYCGIHLRLENPEATPGKKSKGKSKINEEEFNEEAEGYVFKIDHEGDLIYGKTGLVLKSAQEKIIIGRKIRKKGILNLTEEDVALCKRRGFKYILDYDKSQLPPVEDDICE